MIYKFSKPESLAVSATYEADDSVSFVTTGRMVSPEGLGELMGAELLEIKNEAPKDANPCDSELSIIYGVVFKEVKRAKYVRPQGEHPTIQRYIDFAYSNMDVQYCKSFQRTLCLMLLSNLLSDKVCVRSGHRKTYLNLYAMILGKSSVSGKTTSLEIMRRVLDDVCEIVANPHPRISSSFNLDGLNRVLLTRKGVVYIQGDEADGIIKRWQRNPGVIELLTDAYTSNEVVKRSTPSLIRDKNIPDRNTILTNILLLATPESLNDSIDKKYFESGFLYRFLMSYDTGATKTANFLQEASEGEDEYIDVVVDCIRFWDKMALMDISLEFEPKAISYINKNIGIIEDNLEDNEATSPLFERMKMNVIKIAGLLSCGQKSKEIDIECAKYAVKYAYEYLEVALDVYEQCGGDIVKTKIVNALKGRSLKAETLAKRIRENIDTTKRALKELDDKVHVDYNGSYCLNREGKDEEMWNERNVSVYEKRGF